MTSLFGVLGDVLEGWHRLSLPPPHALYHNYYINITKHSLTIAKGVYRLLSTLHIHDTQNCTNTLTLFHAQLLPLLLPPYICANYQVDAVFACTCYYYLTTIGEATPFLFVLYTLSVFLLSFTFPLLISVLILSLPRCYGL